MRREGSVEARRACISQDRRACSNAEETSDSAPRVPARDGRLRARQTQGYLQWILRSPLTGLEPSTPAHFEERFRSTSHRARLGERPLLRAARARWRRFRPPGRGTCSSLRPSNATAINARHGRRRSACLFTPPGCCGDVRSGLAAILSGFCGVGTDTGLAAEAPAPVGRGVRQLRASRCH